MKSLLSILLVVILILVVFEWGCDTQKPSNNNHSSKDLIAIWGSAGNTPGKFVKPRALVFSPTQQWLYVVDITSRIQAFDLQGHHVQTFTTPECAKGKPTGLGVMPNGNLLVADTHYHRILLYSPEGKLLKQFGEYGTLPHQFVFATDVAMDQQGFIYVSQYGDAFGKYDRIQKFTSDGIFVKAWGESGTNPGQFERPMSLAIENDGNILVADACNHRIQRFTNQGKLLNIWGEPGTDPGQLSYPYGIALDKNGNIYVSEFGNNRIQKFTPQGVSLGCFGIPGSSKGMFANPWDVDVGTDGFIYVADALNHRVQRLDPNIWSQP